MDLLRFPQSLLPPESQKWARSIEAALQKATRDSSRAEGSGDRANSSNAATLGSIERQLRSIQEQQAEIQAQNVQIQSTLDYLSGLISVAITGASFNSGPQPGDATMRVLTSAESLATFIDIEVSTGKLLVSYGCAEMSVSPAGTDGAAVGYMGFDVDGGEPRSYTRVYAAGGARIGSGAARSAVVDVEPGLTVRVRLRAAVWSSGSDSTASVQFNVPWLTAQVI